MILVDTSVLIDFFKGRENKATDLFREVLQRQIPFGITPIILQEVLQGAKTEKEFSTLSEYLVSQKIFYPRDPIQTFSRAARLYFDCRKKGITIRSTIDCLIVQVALEHELFLLHNDKDFDAIASVVGLCLYKGLSS